MKKVLMVIAIMAVMIWPGCATMPKGTKKPEAKIIKTDIDSLSLRDITLVFDVEISNPYPVELKLDGIIFDVKVENKQLFKTETSKGLKIKK
jgi:LEA14-like dessication related protein